jgi:hypothetical protein
VKPALCIVLCAVGGFLAACGSGKNHSQVGTVPPPQPTTGHTGVPSTPSNTNRTTTSTSP